MMTVTTPPPARALSGSAIYVKGSTDLLTGTPATFDITISAGPSTAQTLELSWSGASVILTADTEWPLQGGGESLADYTLRVADALRSVYQLSSTFDVLLIDAGAGTIQIRVKVTEVLDLGQTNGLSGVTVAETDGTVASAESSLGAYVEAWLETGDFNTARRLIALHSPYDQAGETWLNIAPAFAFLKPHLPPETTIAPAIIASLIHGEATDCIAQYRLRYADKYGTPAVAELLQVTSSVYTAILGAKSKDSLHDPAAALRHAYRRRDKKLFRKPVTPEQPDWMYWVAPTSAVATGVYAFVTITWSSGAQTTYLPFGETPIEVEAGKMYFFGCGYMQLKLGTAPPPSGADDAVIVAYQFALTTGTFMIGVHSVDYEVHYRPWSHYLMFENGVGGCESVWMGGVAEETYSVASEEYALADYPAKPVREGDFATFGAEGRGLVELRSGWFEEAYYPEHLRQLMLAQRVWWIDLTNKRFVPVTVEAGEMDVKKDDETLFAFSVKVRNAWSDRAANV